MLSIHPQARTTLAVYSAQFATLNFILPIRWRRAALCLKGMAATNGLFR